MSLRRYHVYILASGHNGTLYIGVTGNLQARIAQHRPAKLAGFSKRYTIRGLVHVEEFDDVRAAIAREKALKKWNRQWKLRLIEENNPDWRDLWDDING